MEKSKRVIYWFIILNICLMFIATIILYVNFSAPYIINNTSTTTIIDFYSSSLFLLALPALSCLSLVCSIKYKRCCLISGFLSFAFLFVIAIGPVLITSLDSFSSSWIVSSSSKLGSGYYTIARFGEISFYLCIVRLIIAIIQHKMNPKIKVTKNDELHNTEKLVK